MSESVDVVLAGGPTVYALAPVSAAAKAIFEREARGPENTWLDGALLVEHRYLDGVMEALAGEGLSVGAAP